MLSLAAATQYATILRSQIEPAVEAGEVVIAESWWDKTWQRRLLPPSPLPAHQHLTVLVDVAQHDRVACYQAAGRPDPYVDHTGPDSHHPDGFGRFTEHIADQLSPSA